MNEIGEKNKNSKKVLLIVGIVMSVALISILIILLLKPQNEPNYAKNDSDINEDDESYEDDEEWEEEESEENEKSELKNVYFYRYTDSQDSTEYEYTVHTGDTSDNNCYIIYSGYQGYNCNIINTYTCKEKNCDILTNYESGDVVVIYDKDYMLYDKKTGNLVKKLNIHDTIESIISYGFNSNNETIGLILRKGDYKNGFQYAYYDLENNKYIIPFGKYKKIYVANEEYIAINNNGYIQLIDYSENEIVKLIEEEESGSEQVYEIKLINKDGKDAVHLSMYYGSAGDGKDLHYDYYYIKSTKELIKEESIIFRNC